MSRTFHHGAPPRYLNVKTPGKYSGWLFEGATRSPTRRWVKRLVNRAARRFHDWEQRAEMNVMFDEGLQQDYDEHYQTESQFYRELYNEQKELEASQYEPEPGDYCPYDDWYFDSEGDGESYYPSSGVRS